MPTLSQQEAANRSMVANVLYHIDTVDPTANDDRNKRYIRGSRWVNTATQTEFVCVGNEPTAAVWKDTTSGGTSTIHTDTVDPTANDDTGDGYAVGTIWVNTVTDAVFIAADVTATAAVWIAVAGGAGSVHTAAADPTINDDSGDGYTVGTIWVNTTTDAIYIAADVTVGAAVWSGIGGGTASTISATPSGNNAGTNVQAQLDNINNAIANVFFMGRVMSLALIPHTIAGAYSVIWSVPPPTYVVTYNTIAL